MHQEGINVSLAKLGLLSCSFSYFPPLPASLLREYMLLLFSTPLASIPSQLFYTSSSTKPFSSALSSLPPSVPLLVPPFLAASPPSSPSGRGDMCALQSAAPVLHCLPRPPHHPLPSPCAFRPLCLIHELPVAPVMSHLGHRKAQCK